MCILSHVVYHNALVSMLSLGEKVVHSKISHIIVIPKDILSCDPLYE